MTRCWNMDRKGRWVRLRRGIRENDWSMMAVWVAAVLHGRLVQLFHASPYLFQNHRGWHFFKQRKDYLHRQRMSLDEVQ